jgi:hypothetical protein
MVLCSPKSYALRTASIKADESVPSATIELEQRVLHQLGPVEGDGEVGDLNVTRARVHGQRARTGAGLRVHLGFLLELQT